MNGRTPYVCETEVILVKQLTGGGNMSEDTNTSHAIIAPIVRGPAFEVRLLKLPG
jgi:hypothetical protein